jgi:glycosyltransferase involved in cell wall biosynthesis
MLIGIDASRAISTTPTGTETYSRQVISALLNSDAPSRFRLYTRSVPPPGLFPPTENYDVRTIPFTHLWTHLRLSAEMIADAPEVLFVPAHVLPLISPRKSLVTVHDLGYLHFPQAHRAPDRWYLDVSTRWNVHSAACVIADSYATQGDLTRFYDVNPGKIRVVYPALEADLFHPVLDPDEIAAAKRRYDIQGEYILSVGTIHPRKNYQGLIRAFQCLPRKYALVIVGKKGWLFQEILANVQGLNLGGRVKFIDYVPAADLPALYSGARLCAFPSLYDGFGFPVLEAQACGTPVVCSNTSSLPEVAGDGAEFFDPRDAEAMTYALTRVSEDDARRKELIEGGRVNLRRFSWSHAAREILDIITSL